MPHLPGLLVCLILAFLPCVEVFLAPVGYLQNPSLKNSVQSRPSLCTRRTNFRGQTRSLKPAVLRMSSEQDASEIVGFYQLIDDGERTFNAADNLVLRADGRVRKTSSFPRQSL
jgi:hypothetical protein